MNPSALVRMITISTLLSVTPACGQDSESDTGTGATTVATTSTTGDAPTTGADASSGSEVPVVCGDGELVGDET